MKKWVLLFLVTLAIAACGWVYFDAHRPYRAFSGNLILTIEPGKSAPEIAQSLVERGVLRHSLPFLVLHALGRRRHRTLKAGEYLFDGPASPLDVYEKIAQGRIYYHLVVIPEGSDRFDIARILQQKLGMDPEQFLQVTRQTAPIRDLDPSAPTLEGYLFPDSYRFAHGATAAVVVETMVGQFRKVLGADFAQDFGPGFPSLHDVLTLASLIEKETPDPAERSLIAGVFERRLAAGMTLDCDPTVAYAARLDSGLPGPAFAPITESQLQSPSPYNTYRQPGLPPGPICSPGEVSLRAALHPAAGKALYFVSNNHGGHVFASTLAEHERNVARYRREIASSQPIIANGASTDSKPEPAVAKKTPRHRERRKRVRRRSRRARHKEPKGAHS
ncbi:MAG TPA: endolytic transglycosylase MltG [Terriglobia bacterium]|nr:endolytic transglycosylase MltG [Terriglobia bacterium]